MFQDSLNEMKGFKYQLTMKVLLIKYEKNRDIEFAPVHFNTTIKTVIGLEDILHKSFQVFNRIDNCTSEGSGWIIEFFFLSGFSFTDTDN